MAQNPQPDWLAMSPLEACPESPNCVHEAHVFQEPASDLADHVEAVLQEMGPVSFTRGTIDTHEMHAVFRVWFFKDDVNVTIQVHEGQTVLFIRSASRTGYSDLGVNDRRVDRILATLNERLI